MAQDRQIKPKVSLIWFKRDLRLSDHAPLMAAIASGHPILPLFVVEPDYWQLPTSARRHWQFAHDCLTDLRARFASWQQPFFIRIGTVEQTLSDLQEHVEIDAIFAHEETGGAWSYARDERVRTYCEERMIAFHEYPANGVARRFFNRDKWALMRAQRMAGNRLIPPKSLPHPLAIHGPETGALPAKNDPLFGEETSINTHIQQGGREAAITLLKVFLVSKSKNYVRNLASPSKAEASCLRLSPHLVWGTISSREVTQTIANYITDPDNQAATAEKKSARAVLSRIAWRCHFIQKLEDQPDIESFAMHPLYEDVRKGPSNAQFYQAWATGHTGYPLIDACMRCLIKTGWLPFRMRAMLVSFASYHLWLDWRVTAPHLAKLFTDYEPGIHYSQFQMQSGVTGINTIRIYNPLKQSQDHDEHGHFIRKYCPELAAIPDEYIHQPHDMPPLEAISINFTIGIDYPLPVVDNVEAMRAARDKIFAPKKQPEFQRLAARVYQKMGSRNRPLGRKKSPRQKPASDQLPLL